MNKNKYRGQREGDEWVYGSLVVDGFHSFIIGGGYFYPATENRESIGFFDFSEVIPETVGQFTGLKDKNGVEIYEGDVVKVTDDEGEISELYSDTGVGVVEWFDREGFWNITKIENMLGELVYVYGVEVIGNIHDNPCLLEE